VLDESPSFQKPQIPVKLVIKEDELAVVETKEKIVKGEEVTVGEEPTNETTTQTENDHDS
jgi:hypothetical protein